MSGKATSNSPKPIENSRRSDGDEPGVPGGITRCARAGTRPAPSPLARCRLNHQRDIEPEQYDTMRGHRGIAEVAHEHARAAEQHRFGEQDPPTGSPNERTCRTDALARWLRKKIASRGERTTTTSKRPNVSQFVSATEAPIADRSCNPPATSMRLQATLKAVTAI